MLSLKIVKCKIIKLTKIKEDILDQEWLKYQFWVQSGIDLGIYSTYKCQFNWHRDQRREIKEKDYSMKLNSRIIKIEINKNKLSNYWFNFKTKEKYGGIWVAIKPTIPLDDLKIRDCKIVKRKDIFFVDLTVKKEVEVKPYKSVISVDIGEKVLATVCDSNGKPIFYGAEIRGVRRHFNHTRKQLGRKKRLDKIRSLGQRESNIVDNQIHKIAKEIVNLALNMQSAIVLGNLKNLRKSTRVKGKRFNRIINSFAYNKLTRYIEFNAKWEGVQVFKIDESYTSKTCSECGQIGSRINQGLFKCKCGYQVNADFNGSKNIKQRFLEKLKSDSLSDDKSLSKNGVLLEPESINGESYG